MAHDIWVAEDEYVKFGATLLVRQRGLDGRITTVTAGTQVEIPGGLTPEERKQAAYDCAEHEFRTGLGLGTVMDLPGARVHIDTWLW